MQRRSKWKGDNAGMWDKTIGGHVTKGDSFSLTILKECAEELGIPSTIVPRDEFDHTLSVTDLNILAVLTKISYLDHFKSHRKLANGKSWIEPSMTQYYIGYYDGAIRFVDSESCGIQVFTKQELEKELKEFPKTFTDDIKYIMEKFGKMIKKAPARVQKVNNY